MSMVADELTFDDALRIARGCFDYGGGYRDCGEREIFHHGIQTVVNALTAASERGLSDLQIRVLHSIGAEKAPESPAAGRSPLDAATDTNEPQEAAETL